MAEPARTFVYAVRERPVLFSGEMVRAILDGRKTQTRRLVTAKAWDPTDMPLRKVVHHVEAHVGIQAYFGDEYWGIGCPFGVPGDRLWVRETWAAHPLDESEPPERIMFAADGSNYGCGKFGKGVVRGPRHLDSDDGEGGGWRPLRWRPSIHMPRWASRLTLEITAVRVERLQEITEEAALAEGCSGRDPEPASEGGTIYAWRGRSSAPNPRAHFSCLWDSLNAARAPWSSNPWVWVISFKRLPQEAP